jgi:multiple sugar transport system permease protein
MHPQSTDAMAMTRPDTSAPNRLAFWQRKRVRELVPIYLFILPGLAIFLMWTLYPLVDAFIMSFFHWNLNGPSRFIGLVNYQRAISDPIFWLAMRNICLYALISVPGQIIFGLAAALLLDQPVRFRAVFRTLYYLPVVTSWVVVSLIFTYLYNSQAGALNYFLHDMLHLIPSYIMWLGDPNTALPAIAVLDIWKGIGWTMVIFLAALQGIPQELYEAAKVDGAGRHQRFWHLTLPLLQPTIRFLVVVLAIGAFNSFIQVWIMTGGGPLHSTETVLTYMYRNAFADVDFGYGAAISYLYTAFMFVISMIEIRLLRRRYQY